MSGIKAVFKEKQEAAALVKTFCFMPLERFSYHPGQYGIFIINKEGRDLAKPFSFSSSPNRRNIEITTVMSGSEYKTALDSLKPGDEITVKGPAGAFTLDAAGGRGICFLAGGIGITPVKSMIEYAAEANLPLDCVLFYANRSIERIVFKKEIEAISLQAGIIKIIHVVSQVSEEEKRKFGCESGRIDAEMIQRNVFDYSERQFYIVGPPPFNEAVGKAVKSLKIRNDRITTENFSGY